MFRICKICFLGGIQIAAAEVGKTVTSSFGGWLGNDYFFLAVSFVFIVWEENFRRKTRKTVDKEEMQCYNSEAVRERVKN